MHDLSTTQQRADKQAKAIDQETRSTKTTEESILYEGHAVTLLDTYSRGHKRIALVMDGEGDKFEVFMEQLTT